MTHHIKAAWLSILAILTPIAPREAHAEILTYGFSGVITSHENYTDLPIEQALPVGTPWRMIYTFDPSVPIEKETRYLDLDRAWYNTNEATTGRAFNATGIFGDQSYAQVAGDYGREGIFALNDDAIFSNGAPPEDFYVIQAHHFPGVEGINFFGMLVILRGTNDAHAAVSLDMQPDLSRYPVTAFLLWSENFLSHLEQGYAIHGSVDHFFVVPEPGSSAALIILVLSRGLCHRP